MRLFTHHRLTPSVPAPFTRIVSYNGGGNDWAAGSQLLNSVGSGAATTAVNVACSTGQQSPINVVDATGIATTAVYDSTLAPLSFYYPSVSTYKLEMNGARALRHKAVACACAAMLFGSRLTGAWRIPPPPRPRQSTPWR